MYLYHKACLRFTRIQLLNLINSSQLNTNMFLDITYRHIYGLPFEDFTYLLGGLPLTDIVLQFKLNVYTNRLSEMSSDSLPAPKRKPQPRVVPRPASGRSKSSGASTPTLSSKPSSGTSTPRTNKFPTPSSTEIIRLLAMARSWTAKQGAESGLRAMDMRYQLVQTYVTLQPQGWEPLFENGELAQAAEDAFTVSEGDEEIQKSSTRYRRLLQVRLSVMKPKRS